jgi:hypothetical protein
MVDMKAEDVEQITSESPVRFKQSDSFELWVNEQAYKGQTRVTSDRRICVTEDVQHPERHWWIISNGLLESTDPPLRSHADIFDYLIAINLCVEAPVFFSQSPGQVVSGAYRTADRGLEYRNKLSLGNPATALLAMNEMPERVTVSTDVGDVYKKVRDIRSKQIDEDSELDLRVALHMYDDALSSDIWTAMTNLYFVCENVLFYGAEGNKDEKIAERTSLSVADAEAWREMVNRIKHPDKGEHIEGMLDSDGLSVPTIVRLRAATNEIIKQAILDT